MTDRALREQAEVVASVLPRLVRELFIIDADDPGMALPVSQIRVCGILREGPRAMSALCKDLGISHSAMTQIADRLERAAMVERVPETADRRVKTLQLTPHGFEVMRHRSEKRLKRVLEVLEHLTPEAREPAVCALRALLEACAAANSDAGDGIPIVEPLIG